MPRGSDPHSVRQTIERRSEEHVEVIDVTRDVRDALASAEVREGIALVNSRHTTCALLVNEFQGALVADLKAMLASLIPDGAGYRHDDPRFSDCERGNAAAHLRAALIGRSVAVAVSEGELSLGRFQSILLVELDGPRRREVEIHIFGV